MASLPETSRTTTIGPIPPEAGLTESGAPRRTAASRMGFRGPAPESRTHPLILQVFR